MNKLLLATANGLVICERDGGDWRECSFMDAELGSGGAAGGS